MKTKMLSVALLSLISLGHNTAQAQRQCSTMENLERLNQIDPQTKINLEEIESFTQQFVQANPNGSEKILVNIPVVVHVVYNTTAQNISTAQIQSQLDVLNRDFRRTNTDAANVPTAYKSLAADCEINFCLATVDPNGAATTGIIRKQTTVTSFSSDDKVKYSTQGGDNAWPSSKYLNLWVCNLGGGLLGYAQFPGGAASSDGVVIGYTCFGTTGTAQAPFNKGRTGTHEVGHWLNLRHIWGDDGTACTGSDLVTDTPNQAGPNYGCPSFPSPSCSNSGDMSMNYMDYVDDACMYMFSAGQKARMQSLFASGGARASLLTSNGCGTPIGGGTTTPPPSTCSDAFESNNTLSTAKVRSVNTTTTALIGTSTDVDFFRFTTTSTAPKVRITLSGLPADYDVVLYNSAGTQIGSSANGSTTSETIKYNTATAGATYYVKVFGYAGAFSASQCYSLNIAASNTAFKTDGSEEFTPKEIVSGMTIAPNPTNDGKVNISLTEVIDGEYALTIYDASGRIVFQENGTKEAGSLISVPADLNQFNNGMYFIQLYNNEMNYSERLILAK